MDAVIACEGVRKTYGETRAVDGVSFSVAEGEVFGLVGTNGAGKTTLIEMLEGLRTPDAGSIRVLGLDPTKEAQELKERMGVQLQATSIQPNIKVKEAVRLFASLYQRPLSNPERLLKTLSLEDKENSRFRKLSGGQKQRVAVALALVNDPTVLFFDELTTGLDPQARRGMWDLVREIAGQGKTVFLTTHYMEEAEHLCERVAVIDHGKFIALDTPENLVRSLRGGSKVLFQVEGKEVALGAFEALPAVTRAEKVEGGFVLFTADGDRTLQELVRLADREGFRLVNIRTESPDLDDVFLALTGGELRE